MEEMSRIEKRRIKEMGRSDNKNKKKRVNEEYKLKYKLGLKSEVGTQD